MLDDAMPKESAVEDTMNNEDDIALDSEKSQGTQQQESSQSVDNNVADVDSIAGGSDPDESVQQTQDSQFDDSITEKTTNSEMGEANNEVSELENQSPEGSSVAHAVSLEKVQAVLSESADKAALTPQMRRMMQRQAESTRRVEESIKGTKTNPSWFVPLFCALMVIGLLWAVVYYLQGTYPIPGIGNWNLLIAFIIILIGFIMTMWWR